MKRYPLSIKQLYENSFSSLFHFALVCVDEEPNLFWVSFNIISFCPADGHRLKVKNPFGDQSNYGSKTFGQSLSTANRTCNNFPWHNSEYSLQTPSISMDQNPHKRPTEEQALTFSEQVSSVTAA